ncbi:MAG TPA: alkaline phosphatase family protein, partial [Terracidiphilus sp.]
MKKTALALGLFFALAGMSLSQQGAVPSGIPHLDHVFYIMMENHGYRQIMNNPNAPFINSYAMSANLATNYYAVGHPSLTNYLEAVGGSNFGVRSDNSPDWHNATCSPNLASGLVNTDNPPSPNICPISGTGTDATTPVLDCTNEVTGPPCEIDLDGRKFYQAVSTTLGITIADQLVAAGKTWKTYQENLPMTGADLVDYSDGNFTNNTDFTRINPQLNPPLTTSDIVQLYASKHNPFMNFLGAWPASERQATLDRIVPETQLISDLALGSVPNFSFITPDLCHDMHGSSACTDPLTQTGDTFVGDTVDAITASPVWKEGNAAIIITWDEADVGLNTGAPPIASDGGHVATVVITNHGPRSLKDSAPYNH